MLDNRENDYKLMQYFGYIVVIIMIFTDQITANWIGEIGSFSIFSLFGIFFGASLTFIYRFKEKKLNNHN
ncbi:hypothetical protein [Gracilibacillus suaedae]|uniref:hypothetical protein n=1 Tax=Gracilibacillus suaedae TaxID=2820273 RepID=UPI001ABDA719|nr:hypothetical protein [Gracilibacillus suaedae]